MTRKLKAWEVLEFCELIQATLVQTEYDDDKPEWRIYWIACVASLRTVGHVLDKVDASTDIILKRVIAEKWEELRSDKQRWPIFWEFIDPERNNLLKEFGFGAAPGDAIVTTFTHGRLGETVVTTRDLFYGNEGRFATGILAEAINFWQHYLNDISNRWEELISRAADN